MCESMVMISGVPKRRERPLRSPTIMVTLCKPSAFGVITCAKALSPSQFSVVPGLTCQMSNSSEWLLLVSRQFSAPELQ